MGTSRPHPDKSSLMLPCDPKRLVRMTIRVIREFRDVSSACWCWFPEGYSAFGSLPSL